MAALRFAGWPPAAPAFYAGLERDNSKAYVDAHRAVYEEAVRLPMEALLAEVAGEFGDGKVFRPNRDVRFSRDKRPYKDHCGAVIRGAGDEVFYVHLAADHLFAATGYHGMSRDQVERFLAAVDADASGAELVALVAAARDAGLDIGGSELRTAPRGYPRDHPRVELLRHKGLTLSRRWPIEPWVHTREALDRITAVWRAGAPVNAWLARHVGRPRGGDARGY